MKSLLSARDGFINRAASLNDLIVVTLFFIFVLVVENVLVVMWAFSVHGAPMAGGPRSYNGLAVYSIAMLCSAAASFGGGIVGFLFGVPQSRPAAGRPAPDGRSAAGGPGAASQPGGASAAAGPDAGAPPGTGRPRGSRLHANTNLENISDALTKGLLAIGASQLYNVGTWARGVGTALGPSFGPGDEGRWVAIAVLAYGTIAGLLYGYLATRIYLTAAFARHDPT